jgi:hypothetical protein
MKKSNYKEEKKEEVKKEEVKKSSKVTLTATRNTQLANGKFVKEGDSVEVTAEYAKRVKAEGNKNFK